MSPAPASPSRPSVLDGLRVLDLSRVLAGPLCAQMLADHGADVIKLEPPAGDETRRLGPPFDAQGNAAYFGATNRGKRGIGLDLTKRAGQDVLRRLIERADVLLENSLPGTMARWGLDYASLESDYPRLVYCSISGFGADGPFGGLPGYDAVAQALGGTMSLTGTPEIGAVRTAIPTADILAAHNAFAGILLALTERAQSGRGQLVETTLYDNALAMLIPYAANWMASGRVPGPVGNAHVSIYPYDKFAVGGHDMFLGIVSQQQYERFCTHVGRPDLIDDPRFRTNTERSVNRAALRVEIERTLAGRDLNELCDALMAIGVPAAPVQDIGAALSHPHTAHREMDLRFDGFRGLGMPIKLGRTPGRPQRPPPRYAEHTREILGAAGYSAAEIDTLMQSGITPMERKP